MFDSKPITINVPPGPYPECGGLDGHGLQCHGTLVPKVEPATVEAERHIPFPSPPGMTEKYKAYLEGSAVLYWQCSKCGRQV